MSGGWDDAALTRMLVSALEEAAFLFGEPAEAGRDAAAAGTDALCAELIYSGERSGRLVARADASLCRVAAANMLGIEPDAPEAAAAGREALGELLNVVAGILVNERYGPTLVIRLEPPRVTTAGGERAGAGGVRAAVRVEGGTFWLSVEEG